MRILSMYEIGDNMNIKIEVQMTVKIMYNFLLQHTYTSLSGILGTVFGAVCLYIGVSGIQTGNLQSNGALIFLGVMFVFVNPFLLWNKARKQVKKTVMFAKPIYYTLTEEGITINQEEQETSVAWDSIMKVTATNMSIIVYFTRMRAFILPKAALGENYANAVKMMYTHLPTNKVKIRTVE